MVTKGLVTGTNYTKHILYKEQKEKEGLNEQTN